MSDATGGWQVAGRRKGAARRLKSVQGSSTCGNIEQLDLKKTVKRIQETMAELRCEDLCQQWTEQLLRVIQSAADWQPPLKSHDAKAEVCREDAVFPKLLCVCYGLGSFSSCASARYQLAMLLLLLESLQIPQMDCSVYDPIFSSGEQEVLRELGLTVLTENEEGKRLTTRPTLFYLMHCGKALYNNLLWRNWSADALPLLIIVGNSFHSIRERMIEREFQRDYTYMSQAVAVCEEKPLPCTSRLLDVFSDTAVITFPPSSLSKLPASCWAEPLEPQYQHCPDLEIILRDTRRADVDRN